MRSQASSAVARSSATTAQIASPQNRTLSTASQCCTDSPPEKRLGMLRNGSTLPSSSLPVSTLMTPGSFRAFADIDRVEPGVGMLAAQKRHVVHARQLDVVEKAAVTLDQRDCLVGNHRRSNHPLIDEARIRHQTNSWWSRFSALPALRAKRLPPEPRSARRRRWPDSRCIGRCCRTALRALPVRWDWGCPATARSR